ncbi:OmpA family protein [Acidicapsa dinghuensis]|uniref:OmpA family protein n=2 Tax=Acidicapsa dinghuensis TaxID=2218256 RepID=A0ABW1EHJ0_9BACT|nr:OmpA family protein [Acidicapsa dinghuensis]
MAHNSFRRFFPGQAAVLVLASAFSISAVAQQSTTATGSGFPSSNAQPSSSGQVNKLSEPPKEGFWGHVNPFARKKWVDRRIEPIRSELNELDEVNAKNAQDIKDVDARAQAGISKAQSTADAANQTATAAGQQAQQAGQTAQQASTKVDTINTTVAGIDQYSQKNTVSISFRRGSSVLSADAKKQLDDLATQLNGQKGYLLEVEAHAPGAGSVGIQNSNRLAEAVKRYLVTEHEIPVYRMHAVALGNAPVSAQETGDTKPTPVRASYVDLRLMENSLAAQDGSTPRLGSSQSGAVQQ